MSTEAKPAHAQSSRPTLIALIVAAAFFMELSLSPQAGTEVSGHIAKAEG